MGKTSQYALAGLIAIVGLFYMPEIYDFVCKTFDGAGLKNDIPVMPLRMVIAVLIPLIPLLLVYGHQNQAHR